MENYIKSVWGKTRYINTKNIKICLQFSSISALLIIRKI